MLGRQTRNKKINGRLMKNMHTSLYMKSVGTFRESAFNR